MSTVLWANVLVNGTVQSEAEDRYALFDQADKLDELCRSLKLPSFESICDSTDVRFNLDEFDLPDGMESTNDYMALHGVWMDLPEAIRMLEALLAPVLAFAKSHQVDAAKFNFSIVQ